MILNYILFAPYPNDRAYSLQITELTNALEKRDVKVRIYSFKSRIKTKNRYFAYLSFLLKYVALLFHIICARNLKNAQVFMRDVRFVPIIKFLHPRCKIYLEVHYLEEKRRDPRYLEYIASKVETVIFLTDKARSKFNCQIQ